jgi:hypothetical protein
MYRELALSTNLPEFEVFLNVIHSLRSGHASNEAQRREKSPKPTLAKPTSWGFLVASAAPLPSLLEMTLQE